MSERVLYYATNRNHEGNDPNHPTGYGPKFSDHGIENLRFGKVTLTVEEVRIKESVEKKVENLGPGDGGELATYFAKLARSAAAIIDAFPEQIDEKLPDYEQPANLGSTKMFGEIKDIMMKTTDVVVFIHGYNVSWAEAVGTAMALQEMLEQSPSRDPDQHARVVLFSWPSDGQMLPWVSYKSDRTEAKASGYAVARGFLKVRDFLIKLKKEEITGIKLCDQNIHLLCHSMGNYVLQNALKRMWEFTPGTAFPRIFEHVFLCSADVDDNALESGQPLGALHELASHVSVYYNRGDIALKVSDYTKGNTDRLGTNGASRPSLLHNKINQIDCSDVVTGVVEHGYFLLGNVLNDIRMSVDEAEAADPKRPRKSTSRSNVWAM